MKSTNGTGLPFTRSEIVQEHLMHLKGEMGLSWPQIASEPPFAEIGIPPGTLSTIAKTGKVPRKWKKPLGVHSRKKPNLNKPLDQMTKREVLLALLYREPVRKRTRDERWQGTVRAIVDWANGGAKPKRYARGRPDFRAK